jgi:protein-disulfide isomerase
MAKRTQMPKSAGVPQGKAKIAAKKKQAGSPIVLWGIIGAVALVLVVVIVLQVQAVNRPITTSGVISVGTGWGPADAPVKIVEYSDYGCTYCRQFALNQGRQLREEYEKTGKVRFEYKSFIIEGPSTRDAANAAYCAADQKRFWDYSEVLFNKSGTGQPQSIYSKAALKDYGVQIGLDAAQFGRCVDSGQFIPEVQNQNTEGARLGVQATPSFFINGRKIEGAAPYPEFKAMIDAALAAAGS